MKPLALDEAVWSNADIEFPSTSTSDDIEIIQKQDASPPVSELSELALDDAFVHSQQVTTAEESAAEPTAVQESDVEIMRADLSEVQEASESVFSDPAMEKSQEGVEKDNEIVIEPIQPSAPLIDDSPVATKSPKHVQYPNLHEMSHLEPATRSGIHQSIQQRIILQPFNEIQLKELYHNPELTLAERFEAEFIGNELNGAYKEHPLYELIKKYSQSRYNLKINMLDLQNYIKTVQVNLEDVWKISNQTIYFEGVCLDSERVQKSERYE